MGTRPLSPQMIRFCDEYLTCWNATQAAVNAGYSPKSRNASAQTGFKLLKDERVQAYIAARVKRVSDKLEVTTERIIQELARVGFSNPKDFFTSEGRLKPLDELSDDASAVLASIDNEELYEGSGKDRENVGSVRKIRLWDKVSALDKLAKINGAYPDRNVNVRGTLTTQVVGLAQLLDELNGADTGIGPAAERAAAQAG